MLLPVLWASKIQIGVMRWRRGGRNLIRQDCAEAWPRLHPRIPILGGGAVRPVQFANEVQRRQMSRGGEIRERKRAASEPFPGFRQPANVIQMVAERDIAGADRRRVGIAATRLTSKELLPVKI